MEIHAFPINVFWTPHVRKTLSKYKTPKTHQRAEMDVIDLNLSLLLFLRSLL